MEELLQLIQIVSIEVLLTGFVVLLALAIAIAVWQAPHLGIKAVGKNISDGAAAAYRRLESERLTMLVTSLVAILLAAAALGRVFVLLADEVLDSKLIGAKVFLYVPKFDHIVSPTYWYTDYWKEDWEAEDGMKVGIIEDTVQRTAFSPAIEELLKNHSPSDEGGTCADPGKDKYLEEQESCAKGLHQHARAMVEERGSSSTQARLRRELADAQLLAVIFVSIWVIILPLTVRLGYLTGDLWRPKGASWRLFSACILWLLALWIAEGLTLRLWTEQTKRYDRRLFHSYVVIASHGDPAMGIPAPTGARGKAEEERDANP